MDGWTGWSRGARARRRWPALAVAALLLAAAGAIACEGSARSHDGTDVADAAGADSAQDTGRSRGGDADVAVPAEPRCILTSSVLDPAVDAGSVVELGVYQVAEATGEPIPGELVSFHISTKESVPGRLSSERVATNEYGLAAVRLSAGERAGTIVVWVSSPCADLIEIEVEVRPARR